MDITLPQGFELEEFKPHVVENSDLGCTEMLLQDTQITWKPWGAPQHSVDLGYDSDGHLVGVKIWDLVARYERD